MQRRNKKRQTNADYTKHIADIVKNNFQNRLCLNAIFLRNYRLLLAHTLQKKTKIEKKKKRTTTTTINVQIKH